MTAVILIIARSNVDTVGMEIFSFYNIENNASARVRNQGMPVFQAQTRVFSLPAWLNGKFLLFAVPSCMLAISVCALCLYAASFMKPVSFADMIEADTVFIDTAMKKFVVPVQPDDFDESGNVSSMAASKQISLAMPVTFTAYTVKKNDNISNITKAAGLTNISTLIAVNNISNVRSLQTGQKLQIPSVDGLFHTVKRNESLAGIAASYGLTVENLLDVNDLSSTVIKVGDRLFVPNARLDSLALRQALGELFVWPLTVSWRLTSPYGARKDPFTGVSSFHTGMDMAAPMGSPIRSVMEGQVIYTGYSNTYGNYVILRHSGGYQTLYAHMSAIHVRAKERINQGTVIGLVGNTGYSTGPHLHFTVYQNNKLVNPASLLK